MASMRILVAVDGSAGSHTAAGLVRALAWPPDATVQLVSVVDPGAWIPPGPGVPGTGGLLDEREIIAYLENEQSALGADLAGAGVNVETTLLRGRPSDSIIDEAVRTDAELVVVGSRGHGRIAALLLGSVSAAVIDRAPCSVLIARHTTWSEVVVALDGSPSARSAARIVASWPSLAAVPITVVTVAEATRPWTVGIAPAFMVQAQEAYAQDVRDATSEARQIATEAVSGLREAGRTAAADVRNGSVAEQIIAAAAERQADLVVLGCHGRTAGSMALGSVARNVGLASEGSVLTVRDRQGGNAGA